MSYQLGDLVGRSWIKARGRLVKKEQLRIQNESSSDSDPLFHAAAELRWHQVLRLFEAHEMQFLFDNGSNFPFRVNSRRAKARFSNTDKELINAED